MCFTLQVDQSILLKNGLINSQVHVCVDRKNIQQVNVCFTGMSLHEQFALCCCFFFLALFRLQPRGKLSFSSD